MKPLFVISCAAFLVAQEAKRTIPPLPEADVPFTSERIAVDGVRKEAQDSKPSLPTTRSASVRFAS
jgi:hypothetical protein